MILNALEIYRRCMIFWMTFPGIRVWAVGEPGMSSTLTIRFGKHVREYTTNNNGFIHVGV